MIQKMHKQLLGNLSSFFPRHGNVTIWDLPHLWFLWFESTGASVEGEQAAAALVSQQKWANMPQVCTELDSVLCAPQQVNWSERSGLSGLYFCHESPRPDCTARICRWFAFQNCLFQKKEEDGTILSHFWTDAGMFALCSLSCWKRGWKFTGMAVQIKMLSHLLHSVSRCSQRAFLWATDGEVRASLRRRVAETNPWDNLE